MGRIQAFDAQSTYKFGIVDIVLVVAAIVYFVI